MSKLLLSFFLSSFAFLFSYAQMNFDWATQTGGIGSEEGRSVACDQAGNIYSTGYFQGTVDFDPGVGTFNLSTNGSGNAYVQKLNANGEFQWAVQFGGSSSDVGRGICLDANGNVFVTGYFQGTADFDPGPGSDVHSSNGLADNFILKLDGNGNFLWARTFGSSVTDGGRSLVTDANGNVYATGFFSGTADLDPGPAVNSFTSAGGTDIYILKLDANGNTAWIRQVGGLSGECGNSICLDFSGNVLLTGYFQGDLDFDPGAGSYVLSSTNGQGIFALKLDVNGDFVWARSSTGSGPAYGQGICTDASDNIYLTGSFYGTTDFDPGAASLILTSNGSDDSFIQKLDPAGNLLWVKQLGGAYSDYGFSIASDAVGNVYATGIFDASVDFDPGVGSFPLSTNGSIDVYILKLLANGDFDWAQQIGGSDADFGYSIALDNDENLIVNGNFYFTVDFNPGVGVANYVSNGGSDAFVVKLTDCTPTSGIDNQVICGSSFTWLDGVTYTAPNNSATWNLANVGGCDSVVTLNLSFLPSYSSTDVIARCGPYTWIDGNTYSSSNNTASYTLQAINGCDSVIFLNLSIGPYSYAGDDVITACNAYTWIDGITYTASNNSATYYYTAVDGCDSIIYLDLTINFIDVGVSQNGATLTANNAAAQYQWISCPSNAPISGATSQVFNVPSNGSYACILNDGTCVDTSACITVNNLGLMEISGSKFYVYPNPVEDVLHLSEIPDFVRARVYSSKGELLLDTEASSFPANQLSPGLYFIEIVASNRVLQTRFVKK